MIDVIIAYNETNKAFMLNASGHAGMAPRGEDLVCAAVSALVQTLAIYADSVQRLESGRAILSGVGTAQYEAFKVVMSGILAIQRNYPKYLKIRGL